MKTELNGQGQKHQLKQHQQHQFVKCRKKGKFYLLEIHAFNGRKIVKSSLCGKKLSSSSVRKQLLKKNKVKKNVVSVKKDGVKSKQRKKVSLSLKPFGIKIIATKTKTSEATTKTTTLPLSSSSSLSLPSSTVSQLKYTLSSSTSSSSLLQTLPSPTDEFKSWQSSSSLSTVDVVDIDGGLQEDNKKPSNVIIKPNNVEKNSIDEDNLRLLRLRRNLELLAGITSLLTAATTLIKSPRHNIAAAATATSSSTSTGYSSSSSNNNNSNNNLSNDQRRNTLASRLTSVISQRALLWKNRQRQLEQLHSRFNPQLIELARRRHNIQNLSITLRRPTNEGNSNTFRTVNNSNNNNNNNNNNNIISSITNNLTNNFNNNFGYIFNGIGIKRPLVQDDPSEPEPTNKENIKRIKIANGYQNVAVLDNRYLFMRKIEGTTFYYCIDARAKKKLMCKVSLDSCTKLIEAHAKLNGHPCISQLLKVIRKDNKTYMFFPMPQDDLLSYVRKRKRLPERDVRFLFLQMCAIVKSCHNHGIVLRDLKLRKFVFSDSFRKHLKLESLVDAVVLDDPTNDLLKEKRGCPVYVAPEILKATQTYCGKAADMWSLGVILYTMLIGRYPFSDTEHAGLFAKISRGQFLLPDIISPKARCLIRCLLRQEPEERITSDDIFYHPWMNFSDSVEMNLSNTDQCVPNNDYVNDVDNVGKNTGGSSNIRRF